MSAGDSGINAIAGSVSVFAGDGTAATSTGGSIMLLAGGSDAKAAGNAVLSAGSAAAGAGGSVSIIAGDSTSAGGNIMLETKKSGGLTATINGQTLLDTTSHTQIKSA